LLQADQRGIQGSLIERERRLRDLLQTRGEAVGVLWPHRVQGPQHDQVEGALQQLHAAVWFTWHSSGLRSRSFARFHWLVKCTIDGDPKRDVGRPLLPSTNSPLALAAGLA